MRADADRLDPALEAPPARAAAPAAPLAMVELLDRDGAVAHRVPVRRWPVTIGRAIDCDVVLDDPHAAPHHATIEGPQADAPPQLMVGHSVNGARLADGMHLGAGARAALAVGSEWQLGRTRLRLRLPGEALAPEQPLLQLPTERRRLVGAGLALLCAVLAGEHWLGSDPGDPLAGYLPALLTLPLGLGVWSFVWALGSKLFARQFDFFRHLQLALAVLLASMALDIVLPLVAYAGSWESLGRVGGLAALALGCVLLHGHLSLILPARRNAVAVGFTVMFVVGSALQLGLSQQRNDRWFAPLYLATLGPPWLRLAPAVPPERFLEEARALRAPLEARAAESEPGWLGDDELD